MKYPCVIVGAGKMGLLHGALANRHSDLEVVGMADLSFQSRMVAKGIGINIPIVKKTETLIQSSKSGLAIICTPPKSHFHIIRQFFSYGWGVFVEKPLTMKEENSRKLVEIAKEKGLFNQVGFQLRFSPVVAFIKKMLIQDGERGRSLRNMDLSILSPQFIGVENSSIGMNRGGVEWDLLPHVVDLCNYLTGAKDLKEIDIHDLHMPSWTSVDGKMECKGVQCRLLADWACDKVRKVEIKGLLEFSDGGTLGFDSDKIWESEGNEVFHRRIGDNPFFEVADHEYSEQMNHIAENVLKRSSEPAADFEAGLLVDEIIGLMGR